MGVIAEVGSWVGYSPGSDSSIPFEKTVTDGSPAPHLLDPRFTMGLPFPGAEAVSIRPWWAPVVDLAVSPRRHSQNLSITEQAALKAKILASVDPVTREQYLDQFADAAVIFLPGLLNFQPATEWFDFISAFFGYGGIVVGVSAYDSTVQQQGLFKVFGGDERVLQPDWRMELPLVIHRLYQALEDPSITFGQAKRYVVLGHSKGGFVALSLDDLIQEYFSYGRTIGDYPPELDATYAGLSALHPHQLHRVMEALQHATPHLLATPIEGIPLTKLVQFLDKFLLKGTGKFFSPEFVATHFGRLHPHVPPGERASLITTLAANGLAEQLSLSDPLFAGASHLERTAANAVPVAFRGLAHLLRAGPGTAGDTVVRGYGGKYPRHRVIGGRNDHVQMVETVAAGGEVLAAVALAESQPLVRVEAAQPVKDTELAPANDNGGDGLETHEMLADETTSPVGLFARFGPRAMTSRVLARVGL